MKLKFRGKHTPPRFGRGKLNQRRGGGTVVERCSLPRQRVLRITNGSYSPPEGACGFGRVRAAAGDARQTWL